MPCWKREGQHIEPVARKIGLRSLTPMYGDNSLGRRGEANVQFPIRHAGDAPELLSALGLHLLLIALRLCLSF